MRGNPLNVHQLERRRDGRRDRCMQAFTQYSKQIYQSPGHGVCGQRFRKRCEARTSRESQISNLRFQKRSWEKAPGPPTSVF